MASVSRSFVFPVWCEFQLCICPESGTLSHLQWIQSGLLPFSLSVILSLPPWGLIPPCPNTNPFSRLKTAQAAQGKGGPVSEVRLWKRNSIFLVKEIQYFSVALHTADPTRGSKVCLPWHLLPWAGNWHKLCKSQRWGSTRPFRFNLCLFVVWFVLYLPFGFWDPWAEQLPNRLWKFGTSCAISDIK